VSYLCHLKQKLTIEMIQEAIIIFNINYRTKENQKMYVVGSIPELGEWQTAEAKEMMCEGDGFWKLSIETQAHEIAYRYLVIGSGETIHEPWRRQHAVKLDSSRPVCYLFDYWQPVPPDAALYSAAFAKNLFARHDLTHDYENIDGHLIIKTLCPYVERNQSLFISGNRDELGNWNPEFAKEMICKNFPEWEIRLNVNEIIFPFEYKFLVADVTRQCCRWENGENRLLSNLPEYLNVTYIISEYPFRDAPPNWKGAGSVIPVFSLRSENSFGIGDMRDVKLLIDWAKQTNQRLIQILPVNDTTSTYSKTDSYPYSAISTDALHPVYISLSDMGDLNRTRQASLFQKKQKALNIQQKVNYESVLKHKIQYCRTYFKQEREQILNSESFQSFCRNNQTWLEPYAAFCYYRDKYRTADFTQWNKHAVYNPLHVQKLCDKKNNTAWPRISFIYFLQFAVHTQFKKVSIYARERGIILKGDLPIGISRTSVEAWMETSYFNCDMQAGAPPDFFSATGQNWTFPTYNWEVMEKDGYAWWKKRFRTLSNYFDCFRIDHILGFFRIWEIPLDYVQGLCGHFRPALPFSIEEIEFAGFEWKDHFLKPAIQPGQLTRLFGAMAGEVVEQYLELDGAGLLGLKPLCNTQQKINQLFTNPSLSMNDKMIRDGLFWIANEVLWIEDPYEKNKYHPRIHASQSLRFEELSGKEQMAFQKLHDDFFYERHNDFWKSMALRRLTPLVDCTDMLICGEDLGMIPKPVQEVMNELHILSLELERAPKTSEVVFTDLQSVPYLSVCTTSTHDMNPLRAWWKEDTLRRQLYVQTVLCGKPDNLKYRAFDPGMETPDNCTPELAELIISNHLNASSMLTIIPLQDWFALDETLNQMDAESERINIPDNPNHEWNYRIPITLEQLLQSKDLNRKIRKMIEKSGRSVKMS
jgi:4-alpha-glucanotransferase